MTTQTPTALTVSQLNRKARQLLEIHLNQVWVEGELTNLATPSSGHWYFSLKDANAQVRCAMFKPFNSRVGYKPKEGTLVRVRAKVSLYEGRGDYQLIVESLEDAGIGALQKAFEALKKKLAEEGLFNQEFKQPLPAYPQQIGIVTSPSGAAIHDILTVLKRRYPIAKVVLLPVAVQGKEAAAEIAAAIHLANHNTVVKLDVLIVGRGGGSLEDLWAFNEEIVARAIFASEIPIVSAIGHEIDFSIADFVADVRAPTPSAAAELVSPRLHNMLATLEEQYRRCLQSMRHYLHEASQNLRLLSTQIKHPGQSLQEQAQHLDHLEIRLQNALFARLHQASRRYDQLFSQLRGQSPLETVRWLQLELEQLHLQINKSIQESLEKPQQKLRSASQLLHGLSPLNTLNRGYAIARDKNQKILLNSDSVNAGEQINVQLKTGHLACQVLKKY